MSFNTTEFHHPHSRNKCGKNQNQCLGFCIGNLDKSDNHAAIKGATIFLIVCTLFNCLWTGFIVYKWYQIDWKFFWKPFMETIPRNSGRRALLNHFRVHVLKINDVWRDPIMSFLFDLLSVITLTLVMGFYLGDKITHLYNGGQNTWVTMVNRYLMWLAVPAFLTVYVYKYFKGCVQINRSYDQRKDFPTLRSQWRESLISFLYRVDDNGRLKWILIAISVIISLNGSTGEAMELYFDSISWYGEFSQYYEIFLQIAYGVGLFYVLFLFIFYLLSPNDPKTIRLKKEMKWTGWWFICFAIIWIAVSWAFSWKDDHSEWYCQQILQLLYSFTTPIGIFVVPTVIRWWFIQKPMSQKEQCPPNEPNTNQSLVSTDFIPHQPSVHPFTVPAGTVTSTGKYFASPNAMEMKLNNFKGYSTVKNHPIDGNPLGSHSENATMLIEMGPEIGLTGNPGGSKRDQSEKGPIPESTKEMSDPFSFD